MTQTPCKDCKHAGGFGFVCTSPKSEYVWFDEKLQRWTNEARTNENLCGTEAKWFESNKPLSTLENIVNWFKGL